MHAELRSKISIPQRLPNEPAIGVNKDHTDAVFVEDSLAIARVLPGDTFVWIPALWAALVVVAFVRQAIGTQQMPPAQLILGLALILSVFALGQRNTAIEESDARATQQALAEAARALNDAAVSHKRSAAHHRQSAIEARQKLAIVMEQAKAFGIEIKSKQRAQRVKKLR